MLLLAAARTDGVLPEPAPVVFETAFSDFYIEYELVAYGASTVSRAAVLSRLHEQILDIFNEHGVQIMSPHFDGQPAHPTLVDRANWFAEPAAQAEHAVKIDALLTKGCRTIVVSQRSGVMEPDMPDSPRPSTALRVKSVAREPRPIGSQSTTPSSRLYLGLAVRNEGRPGERQDDRPAVHARRRPHARPYVQRHSASAAERCRRWRTMNFATVDCLMSSPVQQFPVDPRSAQRGFAADMWSPRASATRASGACMMGPHHIAAVIAVRMVELLQLDACSLPIRTSVSQ
jgi:hypothetical protein